MGFCSETTRGWLSARCSPGLVVLRSVGPFLPSFDHLRCDVCSERHVQGQNTLLLRFVAPLHRPITQPILRPASRLVTMTDAEAIEGIGTNLRADEKVVPSFSVSALKDFVGYPRFSGGIAVIDVGGFCRSNFIRERCSAGRLRSAVIKIEEAR